MKHNKHNFRGIWTCNGWIVVLILLWLCGSGQAFLRASALTGTMSHPPTLDPTYGLPLPTIRGTQPKHSAYLSHLYFQPEHVAVIRGAAAFTGVSTIARILSSKDARTLRPEYQGESLLAPARRIALRIKPGNHQPKLFHTKNVINQPIELFAAHDKAPELLLDFGQEVAGRIQVRGTGGTVIIGTGESRGEAMNYPWGGEHPLQLKSGQRESTPYSAFRYATVQFRGHGTINLNSLRLDFKYYPVVYRGAFACSSRLLTKLWYTGAYTSHLCMQEQIWDAPKRDRGLWIGDMQISGQVINNVFLDHFLMELSMTEVRLKSQGGRPANALPISYVNALPGYSNAWMCVLADYYMHTGDIKYLKSQHQLLLSMLRYMKQGFNSKDLFVNKHHARWNFVDWATDLVGAPDTPQANTATDLYTCLGVHRAVFLLRAMGDTAHAEKYARWDHQLVNAARKSLANPQTHTFTNLRQVNAMAIDSGVADAQQRAAIYRRILAPTSAAWKQVVTPYYNNFVLFSLSDLGHTEQALHFVHDYWGGMIREGATTFWEKYDPSWPKKHFQRYLDNNGRGPNSDIKWDYLISLCHGWSSGVTNWLTEYVLGVRPTSGGFATVTIVPHLGSLHWVSGKVPTPHGDIVLTAKRIFHGESMVLTLPPGVTAIVGGRGRRVMLNGKIMKTTRIGRRRAFITLKGSRRYMIDFRALPAKHL